MNRLYLKWKDDRELVFLTISIAQSPNPQYMRDIIRINNLTFPVLLDPDWNVSGTYNVSGIPSTYFIDREGVIRDLVAGQASFERFEQGIEKIMGN